MLVFFYDIIKIGDGVKTKEQREQELLNSGLVEEIKLQYKDIEHSISDKYFFFIADYIDALSEFNRDGNLDLNLNETIKKLPQLLTIITEDDLGIKKSKRDNTRVIINTELDDESTKMYFFREMTDLLQTREIDNHRECGFFDGKTGMFLTKGSIQYITEILYNTSNNENLNYREQTNVIKGHENYICYSPLFEYQLNGNILVLLSNSLGMPLYQLLALGFKTDGRSQLKKIYESFLVQEGKFESLMLDLEKIYTIDKLLIGDVLIGTSRKIVMPGGYEFDGSINTQGNLIEKIQRELAANFIFNNDNNYIMRNCEIVERNLTIPELRQNFNYTINKYQQDIEENNKKSII